MYDPLRNDPRFQKLAESAAPKECFPGLEAFGTGGDIRKYGERPPGEFPESKARLISRVEKLMGAV